MKTWKKKYDDYNLEDLLLDESFISWVQGGKEASSPWKSRLLESQKLSEEAAKAEEIIGQLQWREFQGDNKRIENLKDRIDIRIRASDVRDEFGAYQEKPASSNWYRLLAAACLALLLMGSIGYYLANQNPVVEKNLSQEVEVRNTRNGQKLMVHLNDGSKVKLNSGSTIKYQKYFSDTSRVIELQGEAFFEVARDSLRPFRVVAGGTVTEALGTSFNIYSEMGDATKVSLVTGKVSVTSTSTQEQVLLRPGQMVKTLSGTLGPVATYEYGEIAWKDDVLFFLRCDQGEVFEKLEKWYGVNFRIEGKLSGGWNYSGSFDGQTLHAVLTSIGYAEDFTFQIKNKEVVIKPKTL